jgi:hypothetical protein
MILFIDDDPRRQEAMRKARGKIISARTLTEAAAALTLYADGDLSTVYIDIDGVEGVWIAECVAALRLHMSAKWIIHSDNYMGSIAARDILKHTHDVELVSFAEVVGQEQPDE